MSATLPPNSPRRQAEPIDLGGQSRSTGVDLERWLTLLRAAIAESGWNQEALATAMDIDAAYLSRLLNGEKPWSVKQLLLLPDDVEALFEKKRAESFGLIVVERVSDDVARQQLATGLFNMLAPKLPVRADAMAKATIAPRAVKAER